MVASLLCALSLGVLTPAAAAESVRGEAALTLDGGYESIGYDAHPGKFHGSALSLDAAIDATVYLRRVVDEARPYALQPYLQRTSTLSLSAALGEDVGASEEQVDHPTTRRGGVGLEGEIFVHPALALTFGLGYRFRTSSRVENPVTPDDLRAALGLALRLGDHRLAASVESYYEGGAPFGGDNLRGRLDLRLVFLEHIDVHLGATANAHGVDALLYGTWYPSKRLGLSGGGFGGGTDGALFFPDAGDLRLLEGHSPVPIDGAVHFGLHIGFTYYASANLGVSLRYVAAFVANGVDGATNQHALLSLVFRGG